MTLIASPTGPSAGAEVVAQGFLCFKTRQTRGLNGQSSKQCEQFEHCGLAGQSFSIAAAFLNILSENVLLFRILAVVWRRCWYTEASNVSQLWQTPVKGGPSRRILQGG